MHRTDLSHFPRALQWVACMLFMTTHVTMNAQLDRSRPPAPGPAPTVALGSHTSVALANGMRLIVVEDHKLPLVSVQLRFDIPPVVQGEKAGYTDMLGDLILAGTTERTKADIDAEVDALGATLQASSNGLYASALKKNISSLMDIVRDVVVDPIFPQEELESLRKRNISGVQQRREDPEAIAEVVGRAATFGPTHPYGEVTTETTLRAVKRDDLVAYHQYFFRPENSYLVFVGDITVKEAKELAGQAFGKWAPAAVLETVDDKGVKKVEGLGTLSTLDKPATPRGKRRVFLVDRPGAAQSVIHVSYPLNLMPKDIRAQQAQVMNTIFGGGVFNARLMQNLREKRGFTYGAYSTLDVDRFNSSLTVSVSVRTAVTDSAVQEIILEMQRLHDLPVTAEELALAKSYMMGSFGRSLEDPRTVARFALNTELNGLPADHYETYLSRLERITVQEIQDVSAAFMNPEQAVVTVVGDKDEIIDLLVPLSLQTNPPVMEMDVDGGRWREAIEPVDGILAEDVVENYITGIGGRGPIAAIRHLKLEWTIGDPAEERTVTEWFGPGQYRMTRKTGVSTEEDVVFDGERAQFFMNGESGELMDAALEKVRADALIVPEIAYDKNMERKILSGETMLKGSAAYKVYLLNTGGTTFFDYFDKASGMKVRRTQEMLYGGRPYSTVTEFDDWRLVNGVKMPHLLRKRGGPDGRVEWKLTKVEVGEPAPPGFFEVNIPEVPDEPQEPEWAPPPEE